jgi:lysophospholipase L1-like esterase
MDLLPRLPELLHHVLGVEATPQGVRPRLWTAGQRARFATDTIWRTRSDCCAGSAIAFLTDADAVTLTLAIGGRLRPWLGLDVEVDGRIVDGRHWAEHRETVVAERFALGPAGVQRRVRLWLPLSAEVFVAGLAVEHATYVEPLPRAPRRLLCLGDSITQGTAAIQPTCSYPVLLARHWGCDLLNQGVGGHVWDAAALADAPDYAPHRITIAYGTNDWQRDVPGDVLAGNVDAYLARVRARWPGVPVSVITPLWREGGTTQRKAAGTLDDVRALIASRAAAAGNAVIDGYDLLPPQSCWFSDGVHPNDGGFCRLALALSARLAAP